MYFHKLRCMSAQEPSKSVGIVDAVRSSRKFWFFSQYLLYLLKTFKNDVINNKSAILNSQYSTQSVRFFLKTTQNQSQACPKIQCNRVLKTYHGGQNVM